MQSLFWWLMTVAAFKIKYHFFINLYGLTLCSCQTRKHQLRHWWKLMFRQFGSSLVFTPFLPSLHFWFFPSISLFSFVLLFDFLPQLLQCVGAPAEEKSCSYPVYFFLAPLLASFPTPQLQPSLGTCSLDFGSSRTALLFHLGSRNILQLPKYSSIHLLTFWTVWRK